MISTQKVLAIFPPFAIHFTTISVHLEISRTAMDIANGTNICGGIHEKTLTGLRLTLHCPYSRSPGIEHKAEHRAEAVWK